MGAMELFEVFLRQLRQRRQLTLGQLSLQSNVSKATLSRWESGGYKPRLPELSLVLDALQVTPTERARALQLLEVPRAILAERHDPATATRLSLGDFLYGLRQRIGKTQEETARGVGVSRTLYIQWESDSSRPSDSQLHTVAFVLGASPEELLGLTSGAFAQKTVEKSREALLRAYTETMEWDTTQQLYKLFLFSLLANIGNLVRNDKADIGDLALIVAKFASCAELWYDDIPLRDAYHQRALALAARSYQPLHFHLIPALEANPRAALKWQHRFPDKAGQAYLLSFVARDIAAEDPDQALRLSDQYCTLVANHPDEYPCRLRDKGSLLRECGRYAESVAFIANLEPPDTFRAGLNQLNLARGLVKLEAKTEAHSCLSECKRILAPMGLQHVQSAIHELEYALS
jgi:transcriptional regulator with XRE-family HTH domain